MLPPLATLDDLEVWSSSVIPNAARAEAILIAASTLVRSTTGRTWVDADEEWEEGVTDLQQDQVRTVVVMVADRVYANPAGVTQEAVGPFSRTVAAWAAYGMELTDTELEMLPGGSSGIPGLTSIRVVAPAAARGSLYSTAWWECDDEEGS